MALPGGNIVVFSGLMEKTDSPEALAAVLAHEIQHIEKRHVTKKMIENASMGLIISAATGDMTGIMLNWYQKLLKIWQHSVTADEAKKRPMPKA